MKKSVPTTSRAAFNQVTTEMKQGHYDKIKAALQKLKSANYESIAAKANLNPTAVGRRLSEMLERGMVWKPGGVSKTTSGRAAYNYQLSTETKIHPTTVEKAMKGNSISHFSKKIQNISQASLF